MGDNIKEITKGHSMQNDHQQLASVIPYAAEMFEQVQYGQVWPVSATFHFIPSLCISPEASGNTRLGFLAVEG
jgi:hypothetical protein